MRRSSYNLAWIVLMLFGILEISGQPSPARLVPKFGALLVFLFSVFASSCARATRFIFNCCLSDILFVLENNCTPLNQLVTSNFAMLIMWKTVAPPVQRWNNLESIWSHSELSVILDYSQCDCFVTNRQVPRKVDKCGGVKIHEYYPPPSQSSVAGANTVTNFFIDNILSIC